MATIKDIARELGVDSSTVSMALRDHPAIAAATRERIQRAAARMNYVPNRAGLAALVGDGNPVVHHRVAA